jgi:o-succinylbenzoate synthase
VGSAGLVGIELRWLDLHLRDPHRSATGSVVRRPVVVARIVTDVSEGWGECAALEVPDYASEYAEGAWQVLRRFLVPQLVSSAHAGRAVSADDLLRVLSPVSGHRMAKGCLEMGLVDAELRASDRSLADLLGVPNLSVPAGVVVGLPDQTDQRGLERMAQSAANLVADGYRRLKVKIAPWVPIRLLETLREAVPRAQVVADANGTFDLSDPDHLRTLDSIDALGFTCLEQPLEPDDLLGHRRLAQRLNTRICLDESASSLGRVAQAIEMGACRVVCIKPGRLGGIGQAVRAQALCAEAGIGAYCGGMLETNLARNANAALSALPGFSIPGDVDGGQRFTETDPFLAGSDPGQRPAAGPEVAIHRLPGVGPAPDPEALEVVTTRKEWFAV